MIVNGAEQYKGKAGKEVLNLKRKEVSGDAQQDAIIVSPAGAAKPAASAASPPPSSSKKARAVRDFIDVEDENKVTEMLTSVMEAAQTAMKTQKEEKEKSAAVQTGILSALEGNNAVQQGMLSALQALAASLAAPK
jgi:hypothetical protein